MTEKALVCLPSDRRRVTAIAYMPLPRRGKTQNSSLKIKDKKRPTNSYSSSHHIVVISQLSWVSHITLQTPSSTARDHTSRVLTFIAAQAHDSLQFQYRNVIRIPRNDAHSHNFDCTANRIVLKGEIRKRRCKGTCYCYGTEKESYYYDIMMFTHVLNSPLFSFCSPLFKLKPFKK